VPDELALTRDGTDAVAQDRLSRLQALAAVLREPLEVADIGRVVVNVGVAAVGAYAGALLLTDDDGLLTVALTGYGESVLDWTQRIPLTAHVMACESVRTQTALFVDDRDELHHRWPITPVQEPSQSWVALPLRVEDVCLGVIVLSYDHRHAFDDTERTFLYAVADEAASALRRTGLVERLATVEQARELSTALLSTLMHSGPLAVEVVDTQLRYLALNPLAAQLHGLPAAALVGRPVDASNAPARRVSRLHEVLATGSPVIEVADGIGGRSWRIGYYPIRGDDGRMLGAAVLSRDDTEARTVEREREASVEMLRRLLLPGAMPHVPGADVAVHYRPASGDVGGDFYDVIRVGPDRDVLATVIGDVSGHGAAAAAAAVAVRHAVRSVLENGGSCADAGDAAAAVLADSGDPELLAALAVALVRVDGSRLHVTLAGFGVPPALIRRAAGRVDAICGTGTLLGAGADGGAAHAAVHEVLEPGDALVLATDGLTEARRATGRHRPLLGETAVRRALAAAPCGDAEALTEALAAVVTLHVAGAAADDIALVAVTPRS
jgi:serine phosphatase RsbU (regulator of sigma subunit)/PAS domain-containing protein